MISRWARKFSSAQGFQVSQSPNRVMPWAYESGMIIARGDSIMLTRFRHHPIVVLIVCTLTLAACHAEDTYETEAARLAPLLNWQAGSVVADIGAGDGEMTLEVAERVGSGGRVYSTEIDTKKLENLEKIAAGHQNITAVKAAPDTTNLPPGSCDSIVIRRVYHHFPKPSQIDSSLFQTLKPGGMLAVIDFEPRQGLPKVREDIPKNRGGHGVPQKMLIDELTAAGFEVVSIPEKWTNDDYCVVFRKPRPKSSDK